MTDFFSTLKQTGIGQCALSILFEGEHVCLSLLPKSNAKDKALKTIRPISIKGTVIEVDQRFFEIIQKPLEQAQGIIHNTEVFEKTLKETEAKTEVAKKKRESVRKKSEELKKLLKSTDFNPMSEHRKATDLAQSILSSDPDNKEALKAIADMKQYQDPVLFS